MRFFNSRLRSAVALRGVCLLWLVFALANGLSCSAAEEITPFKDARLTVTLDKTRALVGESVILRCRLENIGAGPFSIVTSLHSYRLTAWYPDGTRAPAPYTGLSDGDDFYGVGPLKPGESRTRYFPLMTYCLMDRAGTYRVRVEQMLGGGTWRYPPLKSGKMPLIAAGETTLTLDAPNAEQARQVVDALSRLPLRGEAVGMEGQTTPYADYSILHHPAYLPILKERALAGHSEALAGVDSIATADATAVLIDACMRGKLEFWGQRMLLRRIPPFDKPSRFNPEDIQRIVLPLLHRGGRPTQPAPNVWRASFGPILRDWARRALTARSTMTTQAKDEQMSFAASLLTRVGAAADLPLVVAALNDTFSGDNGPASDLASAREAQQANSQAQGNLMAAAQALVRRGATPSANPSSAGETMLFIQLAALPHPFRPEGWAERYAALLDSPRFDIRLRALQNLPAPLPPVLARTVRARLPQWLKNNNPEWFRAALTAAGIAKAEAARPQIFDALAQDTNRDTLEAAYSAASAIGFRAQALETLVRRVDTSPVTPGPTDWDSPSQQMTSLAMDMMSTLVDNTAGAGMDSGLTAADRIALRSRWLLFLREHQTEINRVQRFDPRHSILIADLFPSRYFTFHLKGGASWPQ